MLFNVEAQRKIIADVVHKYSVEAQSYEEAVDKVSKLCDDKSGQIEDDVNGIVLLETELMDDYSYIDENTRLEGVEYKKVGGNDLTQYQNNSTYKNKETQWMVDILNKI